MRPLTLLEACGTLKSSVEKNHVLRLLISVFLFGFDHYITLPNHGSPFPLLPHFWYLEKALTRFKCACLLFCEVWNFKKQIVKFFWAHHIPFSSEPCTNMKLHYHSPNELMSCARDLHGFVKSVHLLTQ
jgi:hypothetical protein